MAKRPKIRPSPAKKKRPPARNTKKASRGGAFSWRWLGVKSALWTILFLAAAGGLYAWYLSHTIESRFAGRLWSIPSRIYADSTMLFAGQARDKRQVLAILAALGYRRDWDGGLAPGQYRITSQGLEVCLRPLAMPGHGRASLSVGLSFDRNGIRDIRSLDGKGSPGVVELEPRRIAQLFGPERESRIVVSRSRIPLHLTKAVLAAEDADFYQHPGVDLFGVLRALWVNLKAGGIRQGGSTITQQLAKSYFLTPERTIWRKLRELFFAMVMEFKYDKDTILEIYLNEVYLGQMGSVAVNGVGEAARFYFGKPAEDLNLSESALLAALIRGPNRYSPHRHPDRAKPRRDWVLEEMAQQGWIKPDQLKQAKATGLGVVPYRSYRQMAPYFVDYVSQQLSELYPKEELASLGLGIYTTLDMEVQAAAEKALERGLERLEKARPKLKAKDPAKRLQGAVIVMQPQTGNIIALAGGRDYGHSQFNRAVQAKRQPGSTFKPFVYLAALDDFNPATRLSNQPRTYKVGGARWRPENYKPYPASQVSFRSALALSLNIPTVDLAMRVGLARVAAVARGFGFSDPMPAYPSLALGSLEVRPLELARAYCAFAADGVLPYPLSLHKVADGKGKVAHRRHVSKESVTTPAKAYIMDSLLRSVVLEGTARGLGRMGVDLPAAGKTGTTDDYRDAWFVGYTPDILALVWVGFDDGRSTGHSGAGAALPIWAELMRAIPWRLSGEWFTRPPGVVRARVCEQSGNIPTSGCPKVVEEIFLAGRAPTEPCPLHGYHDSVGEDSRSLGDAIREFFH